MNGPARNIRRFPDGEHVSRAAAEEFVRVACEAIGQQGVCRVSLSGGSTPKRLFQLLCTLPWKDQVEWSKLEFFWGDERAVPIDHPDSNYRMAHEAFLKPLNILPSRIHRLEAERSDLAAAARAYEDEIARVFAVPVAGAPPAFDLVLLGMGPDGHTASLFPHTEALKESARWVVPNFVPKFSASRLTMTYPLLNNAARVLFLIAGADKAASLAEVLEGGADPERLPSQRIRPLAGSLTFFIDAAAANQLQVMS